MFSQACVILSAGEGVVPSHNVPLGTIPHWDHTIPPEPQKREVRILLEYFLVKHVILKISCLSDKTSKERNCGFGCSTFVCTLQHKPEESLTDRVKIHHYTLISTVVVQTRLHELLAYKIRLDSLLLYQTCTRSCIKDCMGPILSVLNYFDRRKKGITVNQMRPKQNLFRLIGHFN